MVLKPPAGEEERYTVGHRPIWTDNFSYLSIVVFDLNWQA
jgi:hypothetical protein